MLTSRLNPSSFTSSTGLATCLISEINKIPDRLVCFVDVHDTQYLTNFSFSFCKAIAWVLTKHEYDPSFVMHRLNCIPNKVPWNIKRIVRQSTDTSWYLFMTRWETYSFKHFQHVNSLNIVINTVSYTQGDFVLKIEPPLGWSFGKIVEQRSPF